MSINGLLAYCRIFILWTDYTFIKKLIGYIYIYVCISEEYSYLLHLGKTF